MGKARKATKEKTKSHKKPEGDLYSPEYFVLHCLIEGRRDCISDTGVLVPACGLKPLSEYLRGKGFSNILNIDGSREVISQKLTELKDSGEIKAGMLWRHADITKITEISEKHKFGIILDRDGLISFRSDLRNIVHYLDDIKRILPTRGRYVWILTALDVPGLLDIVLSQFRIGWETIAYISPMLDYYVIAFEKLPSFTCKGITFGKPLYGKDTIFAEKILSENMIRKGHGKGDFPYMYTLLELKGGASGPLTDYKCGRRAMIRLSQPFKKAIQSFHIPYIMQSILFPMLVSVHEWKFISKEGQWCTVDELKALRLLMVFLDSSYPTDYPMDRLKADLSHFVEQLAPGCIDKTFQIPYFTTEDKIYTEFVLDVTPCKDGIFSVKDASYSSKKGHCFRHLNIQRFNGSELRMEALLSEKGCVEHNFLSSLYHNAAMSGVLLIHQYLKLCHIDMGSSKVVVLGLGAGLLPMFMKRNLPTAPMIEVVESDHVLVKVATKYFGLQEDMRLKVHVSDGVAFINDLAHGDPKEKVGLVVVDDDLASEDYVSPDFIRNAKNSLVNGGVFFVNLKSTRDVHNLIAAEFRLQFCLELDGYKNQVLYGVNVAGAEKIGIDVVEAQTALDKYLEEKGAEPWCELLGELSKSISKSILDN